MKILIHHNGVPSLESGNFGDLAMLQAAIDRLSQGIEGAELDVLECPRTWEKGCVQTVAYELPPSGSLTLSKLARWRALRRVRRTLRKLQLPIRLLRYAALGRGVRVENIPLKSERGATTLGRWCSDYDALFIAGGGALNDTFPDEFWASSCLIHAFAAQGKPVILTGQQLGPFYHAITQKLLHRTLRQVSFLGLREPTESLRLSEGAGMEADRVVVMGDDSFGVMPAPRTEIKALLSSLGLSPGRFLAVNIRLSYYTPAAANHLQSLARFLSMLSKDYQLPLLVVPISVAKGDSDIAAGHRLVKAIGNDSVQILESPLLSAALVKGVLGSAYAAIGMSYHLCTFALSQGVPAVALFAGDYYSQKAHGLSQFWQDDRLAEPFAALETEAGVKRIRAMLDDKRFRETLRARADEAVNYWQKMFDTRVLPPLQAHNGRANFIPAPVTKGI